MVGKERTAKESQLDSFAGELGTLFPFVSNFLWETGWDVQTSVTRTLSHAEELRCCREGGRRRDVPKAPGGRDKRVAAAQRLLRRLRGRPLRGRGRSSRGTGS